MKKRYVLLFLCFALMLLVSCDKNNNSFFGVQNTEEIDIPVFSDYELCKIFTLDEQNILLCYYKPRLTPEEEAVSKIVLFNLDKQTYTDMYNGQLSRNSFYDVCIEFVENGVNIYKKFYSPFSLKYDFAKNSLEKIQLNYDGDFAVNLSDEAFISFNNGAIMLNMDNQQKTYDINMEIVDYALNTEKKVFVAIDDLGNLTIFDCFNSNIKNLTIEDLPQGLVCYSGISWLANGNFVVSAICEDGYSYQIIDNITGDVIAQYNSSECQLADIYQNNILFVESDRIGKTNSRVISWNYDDNTIDTLFSSTEEYDNAYIVNAGFDFNKEKILIVLLDNGKSRLLISALANSI